MRTAAQAAGVPVSTAVPGTTYRIGAVRMTILGPRRELHGTRSDPNNNSLIALAVVAGRRVLLAGDAEREEQGAMLADGEAGRFRADVLKVAHHGSAYQDQRFLAEVNPAVALFSVGKDNDYGQPSGSTLEWLSHDGARVLRTDLNGACAVVADHGRIATLTHQTASTGGLW